VRSFSENIPLQNITAQRYRHGKLYHRSSFYTECPNMTRSIKCEGGARHFCVRHLTFQTCVKLNGAKNTDPDWLLSFRVADIYSIYSTLQVQCNVMNCSAIAQATSRWLSTTADEVRSQVKSCGICGRQSGTRASFLRVRRFPCQLSFHRLLLTHLSSGAGTPINGQSTKWAQSHPTPRN
jgi:hypothetical protein